MTRISKADAQALLEDCIGPDAEFRPQQWEAIDRLVNDRDRLLIVQRTGWGKSTVYFIATRCLRDQGEGPTLIISPLLSLMRNQIEDAESDLDLTAVTINSNNQDEWETARTAVVENECDLLLVSPERLSNRDFQRDVLAEMEQTFGMLVIDEAHCISDWGHDFRPDYRRIKQIVQRLPDGVAVAATTATANDRVVEDITTQLQDLESLRGPLVRDSLKLQTIAFDDRGERLAWLAEHVTDTPTAGIVYCLTRADVELVADWLSKHGVDALPYHGRLDGEVRNEREALLMDNEVDVLVATNALGMGFNKPNLGFVIHYQRPPNLVRYYQEIGRAGRDLDEAYAILLSGEADDAIAEYFIENAFPAPEAFENVLSTIEASDEPLYRYEILKQANVSASDAGTCLDIMRVEGVVRKAEDGFVTTGEPWEYDEERIQRVTDHRWEELEQIQAYVETDECLLRFIDDVLDGDLEEDCGHCANCTGAFFPETVADDALIETATAFAREQAVREIPPRKRLPEREGTYTTIDTDRQLEPGRSLAGYDDPGWGALVAKGREETGHLDESLVEAAASAIDEQWAPDPAPTWVTAIPSTSCEGMVRDFARRLADRLELRFADVVDKTGATTPQAELANSYQQRWNVQGAFDVRERVDSDPVLLVDDVVGSRWTITEVGMLLREAGAGPVYPFALADRRR